MAIFDIINQPFSWLMKVFYGWTQNYAIALLLFAILIKLVLLPFSIKQQKNSQKQARLRPKEAAIRKKYQGRNDKATQQKCNRKSWNFIKKEGHNPMGGCLPLLIQFPIIISLYSIVTKPLRWLCDLSSDTISSIFDRVKELLSSGVLNEGNLSSTVFNSINKASSVNACNQIDMITCIKTVPDQFESWISVDRLPNFNMFGSFGDLSQRPSFSPFTWLVLIPVLIFVAQYFGTKLTRKFSYQPMADQQNNSSMKIMEFTMPLLSVYLSFQLPAVVGLYWIYQNVVGVAQQFILSKLMPLPQFSEEDYKEAERAMNVNIKKKKEKVRSLHRIDEDDELPPRELPTPEDTEQDSADSEAGEPTEQKDDKPKSEDAEGFQPEPAKLKDDRRPSGGKKYSKTEKTIKTNKTKSVFASDIREKVQRNTIKEETTMRKEVIVSAKTVDEAAAKGAQMLGVDVADVTFEVLTQPKKGFIGMGAVDAKLKVVYEVSTAQCAVNFVKQVISDMELSVDVDFTVDQKDVTILLSGRDVGTLIGHHGETLDALQYLANLAANKKEEGQDREYMKISVDAENYRAKREETLRRLARRIAEKVVKYGKSVTLEPMPAHERRIIHAEIQDIENVSTNSIGVDTNRRVLVFPVGIEPKPSRPAKKRSASKVHNYGAPTRYEDLQVEEESDGISLPKTALHPIGENFEKRKSVADYFGDNEEDYQIEDDSSELENTIDTGSIASSSAPSKYHNEFSIYDLDFKFKSNRGDKQ